jgi:3-hydroxyisobutyrate dehydrogenase-like beta-hydroxyacid dehydrogenase
MEGTMDVGFIGLGRMGTAMARNLAKAGHRIRAWNRSPVAANTVPGATIVASPAEAFDADVVFTMLSDDAAIREVILKAGVLQQAQRKPVHVVSSTISVAFAEELARAHDEAGVGYVSAPVFGRPDIAEAAQLNIVAAGRREPLERVKPLLDLLGKRVFVMGDEPKQANASKLAGNTMLAMAIEAMGEAALLTRRNGVDPSAFLDLMLQTLFGCPAYQNYAKNIVSGQFTAGFRLALGLKDLRLATDARDGAATPMLDAVREQMSRAEKAGLGERDWSSLADYTMGEEVATH